jgi:SpoVK/Ycf46/Vps4 family AAA+-type ATPase
MRTLFALAKIKQPSVIFIDEIDSILTARSANDQESTRRLKTEFLVRIEGIANSTDENILVIGATNRPDELDEAARRRFTKRIYIPLPDEPARESLITKLIDLDRNSGAKYNVTDEDIKEFVTLTYGYSAADIKNVMSQVAYAAICENMEDIENVKMSDLRPLTKEDFMYSLKSIKSSVNENDLQRYIDWNQQYGCS